MSLDVTQKQAVVAALLRQGGGQCPSMAHVAQMAARHGVSQRTVYRWMKDPSLRSPTGVAEADCPVSLRAAFVITPDHLTVIADEQNARSAWQRLHDPGQVTCSYATFMRALDRCDPALRQAAIYGFKGLVNNRIYLKHNPPHRTHTYHVDHTSMDLYVWPSHRERAPIRPQITVVVDGYSGLIHAVQWKSDINSDMVAAALVEAAVEREYFGVQIGGTPSQVVLDNAAAHFGPSMRAGTEALGWLLAPTHPYSSWQNGKAERAVGLLNQRLANRAPGATDAGTTRTNKRRHLQVSEMKQLDPGSVWSWSAFTLALREVVDEINTTLPMQRLGGRTRLEAYAQDATERETIDSSIALHAMLVTDGREYTASKNGIQFEKRQYVSSAMQFGRRYRVRYLPTLRDSVHLFTPEGTYVGEAFEAESLPPKERAKFMAERAQQERHAVAIEAGVIDARRHFADAVNAQVIDEDDESRPQVGASVTAQIEARAARKPARPPRLPVKAPTRQQTSDTESWLAALDEDDE